MLRPILRQKLAVPPLWGESILRPRLAARLEGAVAEGQHVAIFAGSGYGKTNLLATWCGDRPTAWVTLDAEDADLDGFLSYLISACERAIEGFSTEARGMLGRAREREGALAVLSVLLADLDEQCDRPLLLVLDDYHLVTSPSLDALVARLLRYLPDPVRLILSSRKEPDVEIAALRAKRRICVLGEQELAFDREELADLRSDLQDGEIAVLLASTGGWPAAMGMTPSLLDAYLDEQVLGGQSPEIRALLQRLALVDAFDADLCEQGLGVPLLLERREWLLKQRLMLPLAGSDFPGSLDGAGRDRLYYTLPLPLRNLLRRRFAADVESAERRALLRRVGDYYWQVGQASTGLRFWIDAGEAAWAADRLVEVAEDWLSRGRLEALASAIGALGAAEAPFGEAARPRLLMVAGELHRRWGDFERAEQLLERAISRLGPQGDPNETAVVRLRQAQALASCGKVALAKERLAEARGDLGEDDRWRVDILNLEGGLELLAGSTERAIAHFEASLPLARRLADPYAEARAIHNLGVCYTRLGEFRRALECYDTAPVAADGMPLVWMTPINRALVLIYLDRTTEATEAAEAALGLVRRYKLTREEGYALRILGFAYLKIGQLEVAAAGFEAAELLARRVNDKLGLAYSLNFQAEAAAAAGDLSAASRLCQDVERLMGGAEALMGISEFAQVRAKVQMATGDLAAAQPLIEMLLERARACNYKHLLAESATLAAELARLKTGALTGLELSDPELRPEGPPVPPASRSTELTIRCFGGLRVMRGPAEVGDREWQSARAKLLLAYLLHTPEGATKARLFEVVYPQEETTDASMNMTLMRLRKALEPGLEKGQPSRFVLRADGRYAFNRQARVVLDTSDFEQALKGAHRVGRTPGGMGSAQLNERCALLERALELYRADFLPEFDHGWVIALRQRFQEQAVEACRDLLAIYEARGGEGVLALLHRALEIDPLSEEFNRELILRYLEAEEPHRALQHFRLCERRYQELLSMPPPPDLQDLVRQL